MHRFSLCLNSSMVIFLMNLKSYFINFLSVTGVILDPNILGEPQAKTAPSSSKPNE